MKTKLHGGASSSGYFTFCIVDSVALARVSSLPTTREYRDLKELETCRPKGEVPVRVGLGSTVVERQSDAVGGNICRQVRSVSQVRNPYLSEPRCLQHRARDLESLKVILTQLAPSTTLSFFSFLSLLFLFFPLYVTYVGCAQSALKGGTIPFCLFVCVFSSFLFAFTAPLKQASTKAASSLCR